MANSIKAGLGVILLAIVIVGVGLYYTDSSRTKDETVTANPTNTGVIPLNSAPDQTNNDSQDETSDAPVTFTAAQKTDAALNDDLSSIDAQLNVLYEDADGIDQGLNDKPVELVE